MFVIMVLLFYHLVAIDLLALSPVMDVFHINCYLIGSIVKLFSYCDVVSQTHVELLRMTDCPQKCTDLRKSAYFLSCYNLLQKTTTLF